MTDRTCQFDLNRRVMGQNTWLCRQGHALDCAALQARRLVPEILPDEEAVGRAMFQELVALAERKKGEIVIALLGGRGAQAMHRLLGEAARGATLDWVLSRLHV